MSYFLVAARNDQPQVTGSWAKLKTDNSRDPDVDIVDCLRCSWNFRIMQNGSADISKDDRVACWGS